MKAEAEKLLVMDKGKSMTRKTLASLRLIRY